jgi:hypothetical protein
MKTRLRLVLALASASLLPSLTSAQAGPGWLQDRSRTQGPGFRLGNLELHPGFGAEVGYDSNVFYEDSDGPSDPDGGVIMRFTPHLYISTLTRERRNEGEGARDSDAAPMVQFSAGVNGQIYIFLVDEARNNAALNADLDLNINPKGRFGFQITDHFSRNIRPFTGRNGERVRNYAVDTNTLAATIHGRSRGGVIQSSLGYAFKLHFFEGQDFRYANSFGHQISSDIHYRFLPNTSLFWDSTFDNTNYYNDGGTLALPTNWRVRTRVGLNGVITPKLSATAAVGYTATFVRDARFSDFDSVLALAGLKIRLTPTTTLAFGYERENQGSIVGLYRTQDRGYLDFQWLFARSFLLGLDFWVAYMKFGDILDSTGTPVAGGNRSDVMVQARLFAEYRFTDYLGLNASFAYLGDITDFEYTVGTGMGATIPDPAGFQKFEAWLGLRVFY